MTLVHCRIKSNDFDGFLKKLCWRKAWGVSAVSIVSWTNFLGSKHKLRTVVHCRVNKFPIMLKVLFVVFDVPRKHGSLLWENVSIFRSNRKKQNSCNSENFTRKINLNEQVSTFAVLFLNDRWLHNRRYQIDIYFWWTSQKLSQHKLCSSVKQCLLKETRNESKERIYKLRSIMLTPVNVTSLANRFRVNGKQWFWKSCAFYLNW